jgi:hypothetical protein
MRRYFWLLCILLFLLPLHTWAVSANFLILDQIQDQVGVIGSDLKPLYSFKAGPCPSALEPIPDNSGYLLMCRGSKNLLNFKNTPGELVYLDSELKPTAKKITLPGLIIKNFYLKASATWIFITNSSSSQFPAAVSVLDLKTGVTSHFDLNSLPTTYQFNSDRSVLALTTLGATNSKSPSQLVLIDLKTFKMNAFPVTANPGAIFFINKDNILVASGGFNNSFYYSSEIPVEHFDKSVNASLHWIDTTTGNEQVTTVGYSPLVITQDQNDPNTFYTASRDTINNKETKGTFRKLTAGEVLTTIPFSADPVRFIQTKTGNVCLLGTHELYFINPESTKIIARFDFPLTIDRLVLNKDETVGYLSCINSKYIHVIDMASGNLIKKLTSSSSLLGGALNLAALLPSRLPPVAGKISPTDDQINYASDNNRALMTSDYSRLYSLTGSSEVSGLDLETGKKVTSTKFLQGKPYGIHFTPNGKFVAVAADTEWYLLDPDQKKPVLNIPLFVGSQTSDSHEDNNLIFDNGTTGYYSPDGNLLVIPSNGYFYFVDCQNGKIAGKIHTNIQKAIVTWLP